jgi:hypothetical protein
MNLIDNLVREILHVLRTLARSPGFAFRQPSSPTRSRNAGRRSAFEWRWAQLAGVCFGL